MEYAVETFSLTKVFSDLWGRDKVYAVDELDLRVQYNEVFGLLGPNGSGKTTTLKMLLGLLYPTKGKAVVLGGDCSDPKITRRIGFLPEESYLYRFLNARETLDFYGRLFGLHSNVRKMRIEALLDMVGLTAVANRPVGTYSKGMARRIGLAQALINDPDLLILDEPTAGLDPIGTKQIKDLILQLKKRGKTILLCSHLLADVEDVCDRIAVLYGGKIQSEGKVKDLLQQTDKRQITTGSISEAAIGKIKQIIEHEHTDFVITSPMDKLETFFIRTVAAARQSGVPTSGALADETKQITDFLAGKSISESVLDTLVTARPTQDTSSDKLKTEPVTPLEVPQAKPDEQLLTKLTEPSAPPQTTPVAGTETPASQPPTEQKLASLGGEADGVDKSILDQLTKRSITNSEGGVRSDE